MFPPPEFNRYSPLPTPFFLIPLAGVGAMMGLFQVGNVQLDVVLEGIQ
jgi:hypothetical protein